MHPRFRSTIISIAHVITLTAFVFLFLTVPAMSQDRIKSMPGYEQYSKMSPELRGAFVSGALNVRWAEDSKSFEYSYDSTRYRYDVGTLQATEIEEEESETNRGRGRDRGRGRRPARGRQFDSVVSPDETLRSFYRDHNLWISNADSTDERQLTTDGSEDSRIKNGSASWVYGEELSQNTAMWWSPSGTSLAFYRFDESGVPDYYIQMDQTKLQSTIDTEAYPKAGVPNPVVDLFVYDLAGGNTIRMDIRDGGPFRGDVVGYYAYNIKWSPDGSEFLVNRTNRHQNILEIAACSPQTGSCRTVVRDEWPEIKPIFPHSWGYPENIGN